MKDTETNAEMQQIVAYSADLTNKVAHGNYLYVRDPETNALIPVVYVLGAASTPTSTEGTFDLLIVAGQSNAVCYSGSNGATLDVASGSNVFEFRASNKELRLFANPIGETPSNAGGSMGYASGGTWFSSLGKYYTEQTGRTLCVLPCGNPGVTASTYYSGGSNFTMLVNRVTAFKEWLALQDTHKLGRIFVVWHQGESGTGDGSRDMKAATKKVFDDLKAAITEIDQFFFCRISQNDAASNATTKAYNDLFLALNAESSYVMIHANAMKYYWLSQFADVHHYDQHACNDLGKEIAKYIVQYYSSGKVKPDVFPFEAKKGTYPFANFTGITIINNQLCYFIDSINQDKYWALGSSLYGSFADIQDVALNEATVQFNLSFNLKRGDKEGLGLSPILGGLGSVSINANSVVVSDGTRSLTLNHNVSPFIVRGGNITKPTTNNVYNIIKNGSNIELRVNGILNDTKAIPLGFSAVFSQFLKNGTTYLEGVVTDFSLNSSSETGGGTDTPDSTDFYSDTVKSTTIVASETVVNNEIAINSASDGTKQTLLNAPLLLKSTEIWKLTAEFTPTTWGVASLFTIMGTATQDSGICALQCGATDIRFYMNGECTNQHGLSLALNQRHKLEVISTGTGVLKVVINDTNCPDIVLPAGHNNVACNCRCIGQSFFSGGTMGHVGTIHSIKVE